MAALHRFDQHGGDVAAVGLDPVEAPLLAVGQHGHVGDRPWRDAGRHRQGARARAAARPHQRLVELAVIVVVEHHHALASGDRAGHAHCRHDGFGAGVAEGHALACGHVADKRGDFARERELRADREAVLDLGGKGVGDEVGRVPEHRLAEAVHQVDILVAVDVADLRALGSLGDDRIDELLPFTPEARRRARIGQHVAVALRARLGQRRACIDALGQSLDVVLLPRREGVAPAPGEARSRHRRSAGRPVGCGGFGSGSGAGDWPCSARSCSVNSACMASSWARKRAVVALPDVSAAGVASAVTAAGCAGRIRSRCAASAATDVVSFSNCRKVIFVLNFFSMARAACPSSRKSKPWATNSASGSMSVTPDSSRKMSVISACSADARAGVAATGGGAGVEGTGDTSRGGGASLRLVGSIQQRVRWNG